MGTFNLIRLNAQSIVTTGALLGVRLGWNAGDNTTIVGGMENRMHFNEGYDYIRTELSGAISHKLTTNERLGYGYLRIVGEGIDLHRLFQQITFVKKAEGVKWAHRLQTDATFGSQEKPRFRFRYRISIEKSLQGLDINQQEFYFKINGEMVNDWRNGAYDLEWRLVPLLGYQVSSGSKLEIGLDYRLNSWLEMDSSRQLYRGSMTWYQTL